MLVARWLLFTGLLGLVGVVAVRWIVVPRAALPAGATVPVRRGLAGSGVALALVTVAGLTALLAAQILDFRDPFAPLAGEVALLLGTTWGRTWWIALALAALALGGFAAARWARGLLAGAGWGVASTTAVALAFFPASTGHAAAVEAGRAGAMAADGVHVLAAGAWLGSLAVILLLDRSWARRESGGDGLLATLVRPFSPMALTCAAALVATGVFAAVLHLPSWSDLVGSTYGRLVLAKGGFAALVLTLGALNWRRMLPVLHVPATVPRLRRTAATELVVAHAVLALTAWLVSAPPP